MYNDKPTHLCTTLLTHPSRPGFDNPPFFSTFHTERIRVEMLAGQLAPTLAVTSTDTGTHSLGEEGGGAQQQQGQRLLQRTDIPPPSLPPTPHMWVYPWRSVSLPPPPLPTLDQAALRLELCDSFFSPFVRSFKSWIFVGALWLGGWMPWLKRGRRGGGRICGLSRPTSPSMTGGRCW